MLADESRIVQGMIAMVNGPGPQQLNGYADHNPVRLFLISEFKRLFKFYKVEAIHTRLELGACMWAAEAALASGVKLHLYASGEAYPPRWTNAHKELAGALIKNAISVYYIENLRAQITVLVDTISSYAENGMAFEVLNGAVSYVIAQAEKASVKVHTIDPHNVPDVYKVMMLVERVRSKINDGLIIELDAALQEFETLQNALKLTPQQEQRANLRWNQLRQLQQLLLALRDR